MEKGETLAEANGDQVPVATSKCVPVGPNVIVRNLESAYEIVCKYTTMYRIEAGDKMGHGKD
jgi:hypothetical protein